MGLAHELEGKQAGALLGLLWIWPTRKAAVNAGVLRCHGGPAVAHDGGEASNFNRSRICHVKSGEADGYPQTEEDQLADEETLQRNLDRAIREEDYARAAKIRDDLRVLHEDTEASVLAANTRFYNAFKNGDFTAMYSIWAKGDHVYVVHPGAGRISGYDVVLQSWEMVCNADYEFPLNIDLKNIEVHVRGDLGYVTCLELVKTKGKSWGKQIATNVFEKIDGTCQMFHALLVATNVLPGSAGFGNLALILLANFILDIRWLGSSVLFSACRVVYRALIPHETEHGCTMGTQGCVVPGSSNAFPHIFATIF
ncbi:F-box protein SKIP8 [Triticum urartu]|uniref:F-box protein SKIP8 n=1 Tax=Triticum urartu TaxID=4572 RepID=M7ZD08_TRIUA|nr:F-box protein SKIP8 [Triticum urartu]